MTRFSSSFLAALFLSAPVFAGPGESVAYQVEGKPYEGYFVSGGKKAPLVLLVHDWDGLTDYEEKRARMLAEAGYSVFAADLFGAGVRPTTMEEKRRRTGDLYGDREKMRALMRGALRAAAGRGADGANAVAAGYCFGGAAVLELARSGADLKGFVSFHGGLSTPEGQDYSKTRGELLVLHGSSDTAVSMEEFTALAKELERAKVPNQMVAYGGAPHAFTVFGGDRYHAFADGESWAQFTRFLDRTLKK